MIHIIESFLDVNECYKGLVSEIIFIFYIDYEEYVYGLNMNLLHRSQFVHCLRGYLMLDRKRFFGI